MLACMKNIENEWVTKTLAHHRKHIRWEGGDWKYITSKMKQNQLACVLKKRNQIKKSTLVGEALIGIVLLPRKELINLMTYYFTVNQTNETNVLNTNKRDRIIPFSEKRKRKIIIFYHARNFLPFEVVTIATLFLLHLTFTAP